MGVRHIIAIRAPKKMTAEKLWPILFVVTMLLVSITGLKDVFSGTLFMALFFAMVLLGGKDETVILYLIPSVFFGYTELFVQLPGVRLLTSTVSNLLILVITGKLLLCHWEGKLRGARLPLLFMGIYYLVAHLTAFDFVTAGTLVCTLILMTHLVDILDSEDPQRQKLYLVCYCLVVGAEVLFGILQKTGSQALNWRALQFAGLKDPNNLALRCNHLLILLTLVKCNVPKWLRTLLWVGLMAVVFSTISFSGIITFVGLAAVVMLSRSRLKGSYKIFLFCTTVAVLLVAALNYNNITNALLRSSNSTLRGLGERFWEMSGNADKGNYAGLTSGRTDLWQLWLNAYQNGPALGQVFGNLSLFGQARARIGMGSHNGYLDIMFRYGLVGLGLLVVVIGRNVIVCLKKKQYMRLAMSLLMLVNVFARSVNVAGTLLYAFMA